MTASVVLLMQNFFIWLRRLRILPITCLATLTAAPFSDRKRVEVSADWICDFNLSGLPLLGRLLSCCTLPTSSPAKYYSRQPHHRVCAAWRSSLWIASLKSSAFVFHMLVHSASFWSGVHLRAWIFWQLTVATRQEPSSTMSKLADPG